MAVMPVSLRRRPLLLLAVFTFIWAGLLLTSKRIGARCADGRPCNGLNGGKRESTIVTTSREQKVLVIDETPFHGTAKDLNTVTDHDSATRNGASQIPIDQAAVNIPSDEHPPPNSNGDVNTGPRNGVDSLPNSETAHDTTSNPKPECINFPEVSNVLLVMKTGASEAHSKIPTHALTSFRCLSEFFIFGDMEQSIGGYEIRDSLDDVLEDIRNTHDDFGLYNGQKDCPIQQDDCNKNTDVAQQAWALDKYKNIHIAEKTYKARPEYAWYFFVDADTYVVWPTLLAWLKHLDSSEQQYLGSASMFEGIPFAHGGSGYLVSQATMKKFFGGQSEVAREWDHRATQECCGDLMFALALHEATGVEVNNTWPTFNGETPYTISYNDEQWCQPLVSMHHMGSQLVSEMNAFERERNESGPMRIKDLYHNFVEPHMTMTFREDWDNKSEDVYYLNMSAAVYESWEIERQPVGVRSEIEDMAHRSVDDCRVACQGLEWCLQYRYHNGICGMTGKFALGGPRQPEDNDSWGSGWNVERIKTWVDNHDGECGTEVVWPVLLPERSWPGEVPTKSETSTGPEAAVQSKLGNEEG